VFIFLSIVTPNDLLCQIVNSFGVFYKNVGILLGDCLTCEELSGGYSQEKKEEGLRGE